MWYEFNRVAEQGEEGVLDASRGYIPHSNSALDSISSKAHLKPALQKQPSFAKPKPHGLPNSMSFVLGLYNLLSSVISYNASPSTKFTRCLPSYGTILCLHVLSRTSARLHYTSALNSE